MFWTDAPSWRKRYYAIIDVLKINRNYRKVQNKVQLLTPFFVVVGWSVTAKKTGKVSLKTCKYCKTNIINS